MSREYKYNAHDVDLMWVNEQAIIDRGNEIRPISLKQYWSLKSALLSPTWRKSRTNKKASQAAI